MTDQVVKTDEEWQAMLPPERYAVLRQAATEPPFSGALLGCHEDGVYRCAGCGQALFASGAKFESGSGWPSFSEPVEPGAVERRVDRTHGMERVEVVCARCGGHLGHVFPDGPRPTGERFCMNSLALEMDPGEEAAPGA